MTQKLDKSKNNTNSNDSFTKKVVVVLVASLLFTIVVAFISYLFHQSGRPWGWGHGHYYYGDDINWKKNFKNNTFEYRGKKYKFSIDDDEEAE